MCVFHAYYFVYLSYRAIVSKLSSEKYTLSCRKIYYNILNIKLQRYSEQFIIETQNGFRNGRSYADPTFCLILLIKKWSKYNLETHLLFIMEEHLIEHKDILFDILKSRSKAIMCIHKHKTC